MIKFCQECNKEYKTTKKERIFCSRECFYKAKGMKRIGKSEEFKDLYINQKKSCPEISKIYGCSSQQISRRLREMGVKIRGDSEATKIRLKTYGHPHKGKKYPMWWRKKMVLAKKGKTWEEIFGEEESNRRRKKMAEVCSSRKVNLKTKKQEIIQLYNKGYSCMEIKDRLNIRSTFLIYDRLKVWGIKRRSLKEARAEYYKRHQSPKKMNLNKIKIIELYAKGHSGDFIGKKYGVDGSTIRNRLKEWGIKMRKGFMTNKNKIIVTDDGHKVRSSVELFIDNWLFHNKIIHIYDKRIGFKNYKTDFYIVDCNLYIEYFGMMDLKYYADRTKKKISTYKKLGLRLLPIFPNDNIQQKLCFLLKYSQNQTDLKDFEIKVQ